MADPIVVPKVSPRGLYAVTQSAILSGSLCALLALLAWISGRLVKAGHPEFFHWLVAHVQLRIFVLLLVMVLGVWWIVRSVRSQYPEWAMRKFKGTLEIGSLLCACSGLLSPLFVMLHLIDASMRYELFANPWNLLKPLLLVGIGLLGCWVLSLVDLAVAAVEAHRKK